MVAALDTQIEEREMSICDVLAMDHYITNVLFAEILDCGDPQKAREYFDQLYEEVKIHGLAEEQVVYPALDFEHEKMQKSVGQTDYINEMMDDMKVGHSVDIDEHFNVNFKTRVEQLGLAVHSHLHQEEQDIFLLIKRNLSPEQQKAMAIEFKAVKSRLRAQEAEK
jgi:hemerythrin superfamily protein